MRKRPRFRATALVELTMNGTQGVLVHADRHNSWLLPGGGRDTYANGQREPLLAAAVRELFEETGLTADGGFFWMEHQGKVNRHTVFVLHATGTPTIVDAQEAPALGLCLPDLSIQTIAAADAFDPAQARLMSSSQHIIQAYYQRKAEHPDQFRLPVFISSEDAPSTAGAAPHTEEATPPAAAPQRASRSACKRQVEVTIGPSRLELCEGSIVHQGLDAVVNAANTGLYNGNGVCGALHKAAGARELEAACRKIGGCPTGEARLTPGFKLQARFIIHAVGPIYRNYSPAEAERLLASAYTSSLRLARKNSIQSVAFPSLSTGIYGYPIAKAAPVALRAVAEYMQRRPEIRHVRFVLRGDSFDTYADALQHLNVTG